MQPNTTEVDELRSALLDWWWNTPPDFPCTDEEAASRDVEQMVGIMLEWLENL